MDIAEQFWRDGFVIVRNVFSPEEVASWRRAAIDRVDRKADLLCDPVLRTYLLDDRLLAVVRALIGDDIVYFGDSSTCFGDNVGPFHKDIVDKGDPNGPDWRGRYTVIRLGLYMQSHRGLPNGLNIRRGSHNVCSDSVGEFVYVDTNVGDLVVWSLRTTHAGGGMTVFGRPINPATPLGWVLRRAPMLRDRPMTERVVLFSSFGAPGPHLDRFVAYLGTRRYAVERSRASTYVEQAIAAAEAKGVMVRAMGGDLDVDRLTKVNVDHVPLPY
jgi:hypothetical protein